MMVAACSGAVCYQWYLYIAWLKLGYNWVFQQNNDHEHTLTLVLKQINQANIKLLEWTS